MAPTGVSWLATPFETEFALVPRILVSGNWIWLQRVYYKTSPIFTAGLFGMVFRTRFYYSAQEASMMKLKGG